MLCCGNAAGEVLKPLILYDSKTFHEQWFEDTYDDVEISHDASGTMDEAILFTYVEKIIWPHILQRQNAKVNQHLDDLIIY